MSCALALAKAEGIENRNQQEERSLDKPLKCCADNLGGTMKRLLLLLLLTALPVFAGDVTGAHANVVLNDGHYAITITNDSTRNIKEWDIVEARTTLTGTSRGGYRKNYGATTPFRLAPGESETYDAKVVEKNEIIGVEVAYVIYEDRTAEVNDEQAFTDAIRSRKQQADTERKIADTLAAASADSNPEARASAQLASLAKSTTPNNSLALFAQGALNSIKQQPQTQRPAFIRSESELAKKRAADDAEYANVRRLQ
jgi:hypothetical protein